MDTIEKLNDFFRADVYASDTTGITIREAGDGRAVCAFLPDSRHANADGVVQGGALYTLADFCFAVAANNRQILENGRPDTVTLSANITYLRPARLGEPLTATARRVKSGRTACFYEVTVASGQGGDRIVAVVTVNGMTKTG